MNKTNLEIENIRKLINKNKNSMYRQAMTECLDDLEKMLLNKGEDLPSNLSPSFNAYLNKVYEKEEKNNDLDILLDLLINNYIDLLNLLEINDTLGIYCFFRVCLIDGILSATGKFQCDAIDDNDELIPGARIITGFANNNDVNSFLAKLYQKKGIHSVSAPCIVMPDSYVSCIEAIRRAHMDIPKETINVTLANEGHSLIVIDHSNKELAINRDVDLFKFPSSSLLINHSPEKNVKHDFKRELYKLLCMSFLPVTGETFIQKYGKAYAIYYKKYNDIKLFKDMNKELMNRIADYFPTILRKEDGQSLNKKIQVKY